MNKHIINPNVKDSTMYTGNRTKYHTGDEVEITFKETTDSMLRKLTVQNVGGVKFVNIPDSIEVLELLNVPRTELTSDMYDNLSTYFPNLRKLVINDSAIPGLNNLPERLVYLNLARNYIRELPKLPETLVQCITSRNFITRLPKRFPEALEQLSIGRNRLEPGQVITNDLDILHCDYTDSIEIHGDVRQLNVGKVLTDEIRILGDIDTVKVLPFKLERIRLPTSVKLLIIQEDDRRISKVDLHQYLPRLWRIINHSKTKVTYTGESLNVCS